VVLHRADAGFLHGSVRLAGQRGNLVASSSYTQLPTIPRYMPGAVVQRSTDSSTVGPRISSNPYSHQLFVDATPPPGMCSTRGVWHTWVVGGCRGSAAVYAPMSPIRPPCARIECANIPAVIGSGPLPITWYECQQFGKNLVQYIRYALDTRRFPQTWSWGSPFRNGYWIQTTPRPASSSC